MSDGAKMSFMEHLEELRKRLIYCALALLVGMIACWFFREQILSFLLAPLYEAWRNVEGLPTPKPLNFSSMLEPFVAYLKMSAIGGLFLASPVILYQLWKFIAPGLYAKERRLALPFVLVSSVLFVGGLTMAYGVVFPLGFRFFLEFAAGREMADLAAEVTVDDTGEEAGDTPSLPFPTMPKFDLGGAMVDAGISDGGVGTPSATLDAPTPSPNPGPEEKEEAGSWYDHILNRFLGQGCAAFQASVAEEKHEVDLVFRWHAVRCGDPPDLNEVTRNGKPLIVQWQKSKERRDGFEVLEARDVSPGIGQQKYTIRVPRNPGFKQLAPVLMIKDYISFAIRLLLAFGVIFELPILISFLALAGIVNYRQLLRFSRWFLVISVFIGALLTPPDVITQLLLALPLMALYFLSVGFAYFLGPRPDDPGDK